MLPGELWWSSYLSVNWSKHFKALIFWHVMNCPSSLRLLCATLLFHYYFYTSSLVTMLTCTEATGYYEDCEWEHYINRLMEQALRELSFHLGGCLKSNKSPHSFKKHLSLTANSSCPLGVFESCQSACQSHGITEAITKATINIPACEKERADKGELIPGHCHIMSYLGPFRQHTSHWRAEINPLLVSKVGWITEFLVWRQDGWKQIKPGIWKISCGWLFYDSLWGLVSK